jgi:hypothetical protein
MTTSLQSAYDKFFVAFDKVLPSANMAFATDSKKEWMETHLLRALDRAAAARYHL